MLALTFPSITRQHHKPFFVGHLNLPPQQLLIEEELQRIMEAPRSKSRSSKKSKMKKSGVRTKFLIESLRNDYFALREENERLRGLVSSNLPYSAANDILSQCYDVNAPKAQLDNVDALAGQMAGSGLDDDDDDDLWSEQGAPFELNMLI